VTGYTVHKDLIPCLLLYVKIVALLRPQKEIPWHNHLYISPELLCFIILPYIDLQMFSHLVHMNVDVITFAVM
jgi:hypothetical protein